jgi:hypothetical protein
MSDVVRATLHTARKRHQCSLCFEHIEPGDRYRVVSGIYDGMPFRGRQHRACGDVTHAWGEVTGADYEEAPRHLADFMRQIAEHVGARAGWEEIVGELADDIAPLEIVRLSRLFREHVGCANCDTIKPTACACACAHPEAMAPS